MLYPKSVDRMTIATAGIITILKVLDRTIKETFCQTEGVGNCSNFSEILLDDKNFDYENVWLEDQIHLNWENHANIFIKKILEELSKYLL